MASPEETTRDHWAFEGPYYVKNWGERTVPERFLKDVIWLELERWYCIQDPFHADHIIIVECSNDSLCWAEVCLLDRTGEWGPEGPQWEIFCPTPVDLGCDIYLNELTAEELCHITKASETQTSHTHTPAPSETSEDTTASKPEQIRILSPEPPSTAEQWLAALAESLHISSQIPMSSTVMIQAAMTAQQSFGVIDPTTGWMMDPDDTAIHRAIGPDQSDPLPGRGPLGLPFPGRGLPAGPPGGSEGFSGGEGPPEGGFPNVGPKGGGDAGQGSDKLMGNPPELFTGIWAKAEHFLTQWKLCVGINISYPTIANHYQRSMLFLTYIQGAGVSEWVSAMSEWLQRQITQLEIQTTNHWLWDSTLLSFTRQFMDTLQQEKARLTLHQGIKMQGQDLDNYIAKFEELVWHDQYDINGLQTNDMFTRALPTTLYETIYQHNNPRTFKQWRTAALKRQGL